MPKPTGHARPSAPLEMLRVRFDRFELDESNASFLCEGTAVALAPKPFAVLCALVRRGGSLLTKQALLDEVWGHEFVSESSLKTIISDLRTVLGDDARKPRFIETVSRRGYRFLSPATAVSAAEQAQPTPAVLPPPENATFVGRTEALAKLRASWERACAGRRAIVWIAGVTLFFFLLSIRLMKKKLIK